MRAPPTGHMVINMRTTITTHGAHNGIIVHAGVQSGAGTSQASQWFMPSHFPQIETPGGTRLHAVAPGTSQDDTATSWPTLQINPSSPQPEQRHSRQEPSPLPSRQHTPLPIHSEHVSPPQRRPPSPPRSPVFSFNGRDSPPDEFIQPSKVTLNVFDPGRPTPVSYETGLRRALNPGNADALINDSVTTTTTVEVFRTPLDPSNPDKVVLLPPPPAPAIDDRPQLLRVNGPGYEKWVSQRTETLINDRPLQTTVPFAKAVQWKETLVDEGDQKAKRVAVYNPYVGPRSPFENAATSPHPPSSQRYQLPTVNSFDERLLHRPSSAKMHLVQSPTGFSQVSHPVITSSNEDLSRGPLPRSPTQPTIYHEPVGHPAIPEETPTHHSMYTETPILPKPSSHGEYERVRRPNSLHRSTSMEPSDVRGRSSPLYVEPTRTRQYQPSQSYSRHRTRRSHSSHRRRRERDRDSERYQRQRSESPSYRQQAAAPSASQYSTLEEVMTSPSGYGAVPVDPNCLPGQGPSKANSKEIFRLYQTRDIMQNVVAQFRELSHEHCDDILLSPMSESEDSVISELSARADRTKSDLLEVNHRPHLEVKPRHLHRTFCAPPVQDFYEELDHIYEEPDNYRSKSLKSPERGDIAPMLKEGIDEQPENEVLGDGKDSSRDACVKVVVTPAEVNSDEDHLPPELDEFKEQIASLPARVGGPRRAHPDGLVFPRITAVVATLPEVPEELEVLSQSSGSRQVVNLNDVPYVDEADSDTYVAVLSPSDLTSEKDMSRTAVLKQQAEVRAEGHKLVISAGDVHNSDSDVSI